MADIGDGKVLAHLIIDVDIIQIDACRTRVGLYEESYLDEIAAGIIGKRNLGVLPAAEIILAVHVDLGQGSELAAIFRDLNLECISLLFIAVHILIPE